MTLPASGSISLGDVMTELRIMNPGRAYPIALGDADVRALAGVPSGSISLSNLYGKSSYIAMSGSVPDVPDAVRTAGANYTAHIPIAITLYWGLAPFSYDWSKVSGTGGLSAVTAANASSTTADFAIAITSPIGQVRTEVVQCIVTDATGATLTRTGTVTLTLD